MRYLLDTNAISDAARHPTGTVATKMTEREGDLVTSLIVVAEIEFGLHKSNATRLRQDMHDVLTLVDVLPFTHSDTLTYAKIRTDLERAGTPIGSMDILIAANAVNNDCIVVTNNVAEFSRVNDLQVQDWR